MNTTFEQVNAFFETCKAFWLRQGDPEHVASCKAFWWDCVECWNFDKSWNDAKREFASIRDYKEGDPLPSTDAIEKGLS